MLCFECITSANGSKTCTALIKLLLASLLLLGKWVDAFEDFNATADYNVMSYGSYRPLMVGLTLIQGAAAKGAGT